MILEPFKKIKALNDQELLSETKSKVCQEREITLEVLTYLREVDFRKLHLERGYSSLFEFCVKFLGYSESSANRRISSMRLLKDLPEIEDKLRNAGVNLSTLSQLQTHIRREEKLTQTKFSKEEKRELLLKIENKSQNDSQAELLKVSTEPFLSLEKERIVSPEHVEIKFVASKELVEKLKELKNLHAHKLKNLGWTELIEMLADEALKKSHQKSRGSKTQGRNAPITEAQRQPQTQSTSAAAKRRVNDKTDSRYISKDLEQQIWIRDEAKCQFVDELTGKICGSTYALQIDHIQPYSLGGKTTEENLQLLCRAHNLHRTAQIFGEPETYK